MIDAVIFDFDGVLVESVDIKTAAFGKLFRDEGTDVERQVVEYHLLNTGVSRFDKFRYIYQHILKKELTEDKFKNLCDTFAALVMDEVVSAPYVAGAKEFLDSFTGKCKFFVTSATPQDEIDEIVKRRQMDQYFEEVYGAPVKKIEAVRTILDKYGFDPDSVIYVGDAMSDYEAAKSSGLKFVARINNNEDIFSKIDCAKMRDLTNLKSFFKKENTI